jgi:nicotinate-nucleotide adenylyltransferase
MKVGVLGGTFDPIHLGHIAVAEVAHDCAGLDRILLVPAGRPPHRPPTYAPPEHRLEMSRLAAARRPGLEVSALEVDRPGPSYTVDTLRELRARQPGDDFRLVLGWDAARDIQAWHEPEAILELAPLVIVARPGLAFPTGQQLQEAGLDPARVELCPQATPDIEATEIRRRAAARESLAGLVDPSVEAYILAHQLYSEDQLLASNH